MEPQVEVFTRRNSPKDKFQEQEVNDIEARNIRNTRRKRTIDVDIDEVRDIPIERSEYRRRSRLGCYVDLIIFILSVVLAFLIGTLVDLVGILRIKCSNFIDYNSSIITNN